MAVSRIFLEPPDDDVDEEEDELENWIWFVRRAETP